MDDRLTKAWFPSTKKPCQLFPTARFYPCVYAVYSLFIFSAYLSYWQYIIISLSYAANTSWSRKSCTIINSSACFSWSSLRTFESSSHSSYELLLFILSAYFKTSSPCNLNLRQVLTLVLLKKVFLKIIAGKLHLSQVLLFHLDCIGSLSCSLLVKHSRTLFFCSLSLASIAQTLLETVLLRFTFILP